MPRVATPLRRRAIGLTSVNEAEFVALVALARPLVAEGAPASSSSRRSTGPRPRGELRELVGDDP